MAGYADELRKLAQLKRNKKNFEAIQGEVQALREQVEGSDELLSSVRSAIEACQNLDDVLESAPDDNPLTQNWVGDLRDSLKVFLDTLPGVDSDTSVGELVDEVESACEEYESSLEDRDYSKEDRDEMFDTIANRLSDVADAISPAVKVEES